MEENEKKIRLGEVFLALVFLLAFSAILIFFNSFLFFLSHLLGVENSFIWRFSLFLSLSFQTLLMLFLVYFFGAKNIGWENLGLSSFKFGRAFLWGGGSYLLFLVFEVLVNLISLKIFGKTLPSPQELKLIFGSSWGSFFLAFLFAGILAPIVEEIFFRGFIYTAFREHWGVNKALFASSLIFSLFHLNPLIFPLIFLLGLILAFLYEKAGSLDAPICLHIFNNILAIVIIYSNLWRSFVK